MTISEAILRLREKEGWRCFHCDETFHDEQCAAEHFGGNRSGMLPACQIDAKHLRELETELAKYREEDTDLHRIIARMQTEHHLALQRAEELGYSRGLHAQLEALKKGAE